MNAAAQKVAEDALTWPEAVLYSAIVFAVAFVIVGCYAAWRWKGGKHMSEPKR